MIIDSHRHLVRSEDEKDFYSAKKVFLDDLKVNGISKCIVIADNVENSTTADTQNLIEIFANNEDIKIVGALNPFGDLEKQSEYFGSLLRLKKIIALKMFNGFDELFPTDERCFTSYRLAEEYNIPVIFHTGAGTGDETAQYNDPKYIVEIAKKLPNLKIVISHFYWPKIKYCLELTKNVENIYYDTTVLADEDVISEIGSIEKIQDVLVECIAVKPSNLIFGSDFPACKTTPAIELINGLKISQSEKNNIFSENSKLIF
ncbi:MAG: amidohydrolase family protein [Candidatus Berkelbacteria bacterium]